MSFYDYNPVGWPINNNYKKNDYASVDEFNPVKNQNFGMQPHTHNAQGQSIPAAQPVNNFQPMGPLGNPGMAGTMGTGFSSDMPAMNNPTDITNFNKFKDLINFKPNPVPTGGK